MPDIARWHAAAAITNHPALTERCLYAFRWPRQRSLYSLLLTAFTKAFRMHVTNAHVSLALFFFLMMFSITLPGKMVTFNQWQMPMDAQFVKNLAQSSLPLVSGGVWLA